ncbi:tRNA lysidine(34) synthetase TilS [archaeon]|nr:MAG: tRNA lysidine(34) synthetase TilS [archaeon]
MRDYQLLCSLGLFIAIVTLHCVGTLSFMMRVSSGLRIGRRSFRLLSQASRHTRSFLHNGSLRSVSQDIQTNEFCTKLENSVYNKLTTLQISPQSNLLLSVSGGADSMALLHIMQGIKTRLLPELNIKVININHRQRKESVEEAVFVKHWAKQYGLEVVLDTVPDNLADTKAGFQEAARNYRRKTCLKVLKSLFESDNNSFICFAHHLDDGMETLMLKFLRGVHISNFVAVRSTFSS